MLVISYFFSFCISYQSMYFILNLFSPFHKCALYRSLGDCLKSRVCETLCSASRTCIEAVAHLKHIKSSGIGKHILDDILCP